MSCTKPLLRMPYTLAFLSLFFCAALNTRAQSFNPKYEAMATGSKGYYEYLPEGYYNSSQSYPLIVFVHGIGELGNGSSWDLNKLLGHGLPKVIKDGRFPNTFYSGGQSHRFIVIAPQFTYWPSSADLEDVIKGSISRYRVDQSRIYITGLSMGGGVVWDYVGDNSGYASRVSAIVPTCGASWPNDTRIKHIKDAKIAVWATHNEWDGTVSSANTYEYIKHLENAGAYPKPKKTVWQTSGHDSWSRTYDPNFREDGLNIYEWMLQFSKGNAAPVYNTNREPKAYAGRNKKLGGGATSVYLQGSGTDDDGSISAYSWSQLSGPSAAWIQNASGSGTNVANLIGGEYTFQLTVRDNGGATATDKVTVNVPLNVPGLLQAEYYTDMKGVRVEGSSASGGKNIGYIDNGDWIEYEVFVPAGGTYTLGLQTASGAGATSVRVTDASDSEGDNDDDDEDEDDDADRGSTVASLQLPNTNGWTNYRTTTTDLQLQRGLQRIRLTTTGGAAWNLDFFEIKPKAAAPPPPPPAAPQYFDVPGRIEAEAFNAQQGVQTETTSDHGNGKNIGYVDMNDYVDYGLNVKTAGTYSLSLRIATPKANAKIRIQLTNGTVLDELQVPNTYGYQNWQSIKTNITLAAGQQTLRILCPTYDSWNLNYLEFALNTNTVADVPFVAIPGRVEAERYAATNGAQAEPTHDAGGGQNLGYIDEGDWIDYRVKAAAAGRYSLKLRLAATQPGGRVELRNAAGSLLGTANVPHTGAWQTWADASIEVQLPAGEQTLRLLSPTSIHWNINWLEFATITESPAPVGGSDGYIRIPARIQAESFTQQQGTALETTADLGGGQNVGNIDMNDFVSYNVEAPEQQLYTFKLRVAAQQAGARVKIFRGRAEIGSITIPATGGWQSWVTLTRDITLSAGKQTLRFVSENGVNWNLNWIEIMPYDGNVWDAAATGEVLQETASGNAAVAIHPNPVQDRFRLQLNNAAAGRVQVQIVDAAGAVRQSVTLQKPAGTWQTYLSASSLPTGTYFLRVQAGETIQTVKLIKL